MNTYFVYVHNAKYPQQIEDYLTEIKAEKYSEKSSIIKSKKSLGETMQDFKRSFSKREKGFVLMIDSENPDTCHFYPEEGRTKFSRLDPDLDRIVLQWKGELSKRG